MPIEKLVPRVKVGELPKGTTLKIDDGSWSISINVPDDDPIITVEYIGEGPGWGLIKLEAPRPDMDLQDLAAAVIAWLENLIKYSKPQPKGQ